MPKRKKKNSPRRQYHLAVRSAYRAVTRIMSKGSCPDCGHPLTRADEKLACENCGGVAVNARRAAQGNHSCA